jgi:hypothetical protein
MISLNRFLPPRTATLAQLISLARCDPGMLGLVIEALLHGPLALGIDATDLQPVQGWTRLDDSQIIPAQIRHREQGVPEFSYFVCSDPDLTLALGPYGERSYSYFNFATGLKPLELLVTACEPRPIVLNPGCADMLVMPYDEVSACLSAWCDPPWLIRRPPADAAEGIEPYRALVSRLRAYLPQLEAVERAYLTRYERASDRRAGELTCALAVLCDDEATLVRIARALPLLCSGLAIEFEIRQVLRLLQLPEDEGVIDDCCTLVYDAAGERAGGPKFDTPPPKPR